MTFNKLYLLTLLLLFMLITQSGIALSPGDKAPALSVKTWVRHKAVSLEDGKGKTIYVLEFWSPWFPACLKAVSYLNYIQQKYAAKDIVVVGIANESTEKINKFLVDNNLIPQYAVAADKKGETSKAYMSGIDTIPIAFVVGKDGKLLWYGQVFELDRIINSILTGKFDLAAEMRISRLQDKLQHHLESNNQQQALLVAREILELDPKNENVIQFMVMYHEQNNSLGELQTVLDELIKREPDYSPLYFIKLELLFRNPENVMPIQILAKRIQSQFINDPEVLNNLAWLLLNQQLFGITPLQTALSAAKTAIKKLNPAAPSAKKAAFYATLAKAYYSVGNITKAIVIQETVVQLSQNTPQESMAKNILVYYKEAKSLQDFMD